jgi:hypothetical protein
MHDLPAYVLDSFAFIAYLEDEPAHNVFKNY